MVPAQMQFAHIQCRDDLTQLQRTQSDLTASCHSPKAAQERSSSFGAHRPLLGEFDQLSARIEEIHQKSHQRATWNLQSAWLNSIWAVKPRTIREQILQEGEDPVDLAFRTDRIGQQWLFFLRSALMLSHDVTYVMMENGQGRSQVGLTLLERKELAKLYPSLIPLLTKTTCDRVCSKKLNAVMCEYLERLAFSAEGWINIRGNIDRSECTFILSWLLKVKICTLFRDVQELIDKNQSWTLEDLFKRHFRTIPDVHSEVYHPKRGKLKGDRYAKLQAIVEVFSLTYRKKKMVQIEQLQGLIESYICHIYTIL